MNIYINTKVNYSVNCLSEVVEAAEIEDLQRNLNQERFLSSPSLGITESTAKSLHVKSEEVQQGLYTNTE